MVAPKGPGHGIVNSLKEKVFQPTAVLRGSSKKAKDVALAWAKGVGGTRAGVLSKQPLRKNVERIYSGNRWFFVVVR